MALKKVEKKVSLNIKISKELDERLKRARQEARNQGMKFNVSAEVESFLVKELKKVEKTLRIEQDINESKSQLSLIDEDIPKFTAKKVEK